MRGNGTDDGAFGKIVFVVFDVGVGGNGGGGTRQLPVLAAATGRVVGYHPYHGDHSGGGPLSVDSEDLVKFRYEFVLVIFSYFGGNEHDVSLVSKFRIFRYVAAPLDEFIGDLLATR